MERENRINFDKMTLASYAEKDIKWLRLNFDFLNPNIVSAVSDSLS